MKYILLDPLSTDGGGTAIAPAPNAPAPTPKPAAPAAPSPNPAPATPEPSQDEDPFAPPPKPDAAPAKPDAKPDSKPAAAAPAEIDIEKGSPKELRERLKQLKAENQSYPSKIKAMEDKIKFLESKGIDSTALTTRLAALEKERDAAHAELRAARQEASPEFKERYDKPFNMAAERAKKQISELTVVANADTGETRPATWQDFAALYSLPVGKAIEQATALFGPAANFVLQQREKLLDMAQARDAALEEERAQFKERSAKEIAEQALKREGVGKMWEETNKRLAETIDDYKPDATDAEASEARQHALSVFDAPINSANQDDFVKQKVLKDAHIRQRVGAYAVQKLQISRLKAEKEALQKQVDELKGTAPGGVQRPGGDVAAAPVDDEQWGESLIKEVKQRAG